MMHYSLVLLLSVLLLLLGSIDTFSVLPRYRPNRVDHGASTLAATVTKPPRTKQPKRRPMAESERIKRRKSPALWRYDLSNNNKDATSTADKKDNATQYPLKAPEVMAPAGGFPQLQAAIANGADSVYVGCSAYSARARAANFDAATELPEAVRIAHDAGVRIFVALNTLVFNHELIEIEKLILQIQQAGVDAVIVQDFGVAKIVTRVAPRLELHASTQQTVTNTDGVRHAAGLGASRVVLGRELSVEEIASVAQDVQQDATLNATTEIEAFVHGALCVSYSGQCFSSEAWGGRSANRGQCAQACRLPYGLITDGVLTDLGDIQYLLSPQDLCGLEHVPDLVQSGVACLKIEGRLKDAAYVAATTRAYRNAVDAAWQQMQQERFEQGLIDAEELHQQLHYRKKKLSFEEVVTKAELSQLFSRGQDESNDGLSPGFFEGPIHQRLVVGRSPRHRGIHIGRVAQGTSHKRSIIITSEDEQSLRSLKCGDGLVIDRGDPQNEELGGPLFEVGSVTPMNSAERPAWSVAVKFGRDVMSRWSKHDGPVLAGRRSGNLLIPNDAHVWRTSDATVDKKMRRLSEATPPKATVQVAVSGKIGTVLTVTITAPDGRCGVGTTEGMLEAADNGGLSLEKVRKAVGTLGNSPYTIEGGEADCEALQQGTWCPVKWIKSARRQALENFQHESTEIKTILDVSTIRDNKRETRVAETLLQEAYHESFDSPDRSDRSSGISTRISILARTFSQVDRICQMAENGQEIDEVIIDFLEVDGMRDAIARVREVAGLHAILASPRIIKPGESGIWRTLLRLRPDGLLIRSTSLLHRMNKLGGEGANANVASKSRGEEDCFVQIPPLVGDFSLNAANVITASELLWDGLARITSAYDLGSNAITEMATAMGEKGAARMDVIAHSHLPIFHTEHCVFARMLSKGNSYVDCGHVCTQHSVHLRDQTGADNLVLADMGCRNTVFDAKAQSGVYSLREWQAVGIGRIRVELVDESAEDTERILRGYLGVLAGTRRPDDVWDELGTVQDSNGRAGGVHFGSLRNSAERKAGVVDFVAGHK